VTANSFARALAFLLPMPLSFTSSNHFYATNTNCVVLSFERIDMVRTDKLCCCLGGEAAATFLIELCDELKATHNYLFSLGGSGKYSQAKISDQDRAAGLNKEACNNVSESNVKS
jgi:hypothetical protein